MNIRDELNAMPEAASGDFRFNDIDINPDAIRTIMINEIVPADPAEDFYGTSGEEYLKTTIPLFRQAGSAVSGIRDILNLGVYITNAVKTPKTEYTIETQTIGNSLPFLEKELSLFPGVRVIMLMGDVAKKAFNMIAKKNSGKNAVPAVSTYKLRTSEITYNGIRVFPSYIMTGGNILIEKSKVQMASEDIAKMLEIIG